MCRFKPVALVLILFALTLAVATPGHAEEFFDNQAKGMKIIDGSLSEGMISGHYGLTLKTATFMEYGTAEKDPSAKYTMNRIAFYNAVNAHRMLDALLPGVKNPDTKREMMKSIKFLEAGIDLIGKRFGWNDATTKTMYGKVRGLIEARIADLRKTAFTS